MQIRSLRENPSALERVIGWFSGHWGNEAVYRDCMTACLSSDSPLPQWYWLEDDAGTVVGGAGLITNDFNARMDLWPWLCALYIEEAYRGRALGARLLDHAKREAVRLGFSDLYLATDHVGYYEKYGFVYIGETGDPFGGSSRIYRSAPSAWSRLLAMAHGKLRPRNVSEFVETGGVAAAILTESGHIYSGICIDTACSLGMCAERNAAANMLTNGESKIAKIVCVDRDGRLLPPCGACREFLLQLDPSHAEVELLLAEDRAVKLGTLMPDWWGTNDQS